MRKTIAWMIVIAACTAFGFGQDIQIKDQKPFFYAYLECSGPYSQMSAKIGEFMQAYMGQGLGSFSGVMAMYLNTPDQVPEAELKWRIGMPIGKETEPKAPLKKDIFDFSQVAKSVHVGPYEDVHITYAKMQAYIAQNGLQVVGPPYEMYLNNPQDTPPEKLQTEISIPVTKK